MKKIVLVLMLGLAFTFANAQNAKVKKDKKVKKTTVEVIDLQKSITDNISKNYPGYTAINAFKLDKKGSISYQVAVKKDTNNVDLYYSKNGVFLSKEKSAVIEVPTKAKKKTKVKKTS